MKKHLLFFSLFAVTVALPAQQRVTEELNWAPAPEVVEWEGSRQVQYGFELKGGDAGAGGYGQQPYYLKTFPATAGAYRLEVLATELEDFRPHPAWQAENVATALNFSVKVIRQPEGLLGKVSGPTIIKEGSRLRRLKSISYQLVPTSATPTKADFPFATSSVLANGTFYKVAVSERGVHRLTRGFLADELKVAGLDGLDPRNLKVYGLPGGQLPETTNDNPPDDLVELAIQVSGADDGRFDGGDVAYFFAESARREGYDPDLNRLVSEPNVYGEKNYYFITFDGGPGKRVRELPTVSESIATSSYDAFYHFEEDLFNVLPELGGNSHGSGQFWFGEFFQQQREKDYGALFSVPDLVTEEPVNLTARMALRTDVSSRFQVELNGEAVTSNLGSRITFGAQEQNSAISLTELNGNVTTTGPDLRIKVAYPRPGNAGNSEAWLDYVEVRARRRLSFTELNQFVFTETRARTAGGVTYQFANPPADARVWRISDGDARFANLNGGSFTAPGDDKVHSYVAFRANDALPQPEALDGTVDNQNLHAVTDAEMLIVAHPNFLAQAEELAEHRRNHNGLRVFVATTEQVYNEFSSGRPDAAAIRNFGRMVYERNPGMRYLLLFGDGSFDHRNILELGTNLIPTYQANEKFTEVGSFPSDDFFGIFTESSFGNPLGPEVSIGVGRLPVKSGDEATGVVRKLIRYDVNPNTLGDWRTRMVFVGDDEDGSRHTDDVNRVAETVADIKPDLNFDKLYFDLFPQQSISAGERYPDVTEGLDRAVFRGALAITYLGHGGPRGWGQERVLTIPQVRNWQREANSSEPIQPPVFVTATCTFSNYDDASFTSAGEEVMLTPDGGGIALLSTTRPVFATRNFRLTRNTVSTMLDRPDGNWRSLGDIIRIAKNLTSTSDNGRLLSGDTENVRKFTLMGDPATVVAFPRFAVRTTKVDTLDVDENRLDTVRALQKMRISGEVIDLDGNLLENFNGQLIPTVYDKPQQVQTLQQDAGSPAREFSVQRNTVFRGKARVTAGKFSFEFVVPNDIDYSFGRGKVSYYARDVDNFVDAAGFYDRLVIGGTASENNTDDQGPVVEVFMNNESFVAGSRVNADPVLLISLTDDLGINVTGNSIGHDLEAVIDGDTRNPIVLNDYYEANEDDFRSGTVRYPLFDLEPGKHTISVRAWDVANNSAQGDTEFIVAEDGGDGIRRVLNYPNPFTENTCFQFDHTLVGQNVEAIVQIYTVSGRLVKTLRRDYQFSDGSVRQDDCISWDGLDDYGDPIARGVYLYQVRLRGDETTVVNGEMEKLVILR